MAHNSQQLEAISTNIDYACCLGYTKPVPAAVTRRLCCSCCCFQPLLPQAKCISGPNHPNTSYQGCSCSLCAGAAASSSTVALPAALQDLVCCCCPSCCSWHYHSPGLPPRHLDGCAALDCGRLKGIQKRLNGIRKRLNGIQKRLPLRETAPFCCACWLGLLLAVLQMAACCLLLLLALAVLLH